jgi:hypothetical protein
MDEQNLEKIRSLGSVAGARYSIGEILVYCLPANEIDAHRDVVRNFPGLKFAYRFYESGFFVLAYRLN